MTMMMNMVVLICTYENIFNHSDEYNMQLEVSHYIDEISNIVDQYI